MSIEFNMGLVRGLLTLILFLAFMTLWAWAWNKNRTADFDRMARLPLEDQDSNQEQPR
ncbi:cbb3-type cytochrome oxidase subunit 3 [Steroidobacter cummioxidans]|uniref:cbb3-type cytochrome oxidase subunit 3 n=1 Tax=Steroidobacter cummioxidans TaxID=1803913 RepID=UPI000E30E61C|nr:cbb3-type cytochrome c oxidase subunit 3 [Steroidobacter cummioxidans]